MSGASGRSGSGVSGLTCPGGGVCAAWLARSELGVHRWTSPRAEVSCRFTWRDRGHPTIHTPVHRHRTRTDRGETLPARPATNWLGPYRLRHGRHPTARSRWLRPRLEGRRRQRGAASGAIVRSRSRPGGDPRVSGSPPTSEPSPMSQPVSAEGTAGPRPSWRTFGAPGWWSGGLPTLPDSP